MRFFSGWSCILTLLLSAGPAWAGSPNPRIYQVCDTILSHKGLTYLEPQHHLYLPAIHQYLFRGKTGTRFTVRATIHSPSLRDFRENINIEKLSPRSVRFPTITQESTIRLVLTEQKANGRPIETVEEYRFLELEIEGRSSWILDTDWLEQSWWRPASRQRMALLFIAMSMARKADEIGFHLPVDTKRKLAHRLKQQLERVEKGEVELEDALIDLDSPFLNELIVTLPALPKRARLIDGIALAFSFTDLLR